jgi:hypothetical protein
MVRSGRWRGVAALLTLSFLVVALVTSHRTTESVSNAATDVVVEDVRVTAGLPPLVRDAAFRLAPPAVAATAGSALVVALALFGLAALAAPRLAPIGATRGTARRRAPPHG